MGIPFKKILIHKEFDKDYIFKLKHFSRYLIKQGRQTTSEKIFNQMLKYWAKDSLNKNFKTTIETAFFNTTPHLGVRTKRKGSKNINIPVKLSGSKKLFLSRAWLLKNALLKKKRKFFQALFEEINESSQKKSASVKKRDDLHKLVFESLINFKKVY